MSSSEDHETFHDVEATAETDKALKCHIEGETAWVPKSQIHDDSEVWKNGDVGMLIVTHWWAKKAGLV